MLKSVFVVGSTRFYCLAFDGSYVKTNDDTPILPAIKCSPGTLVSGSNRITRIFTKVIVRLTTEVFSMDSSLSRYTLIADSCVFLERTRRTTVGGILVDSRASAAM